MLNQLMCKKRDNLKNWNVYLLLAHFNGEDVPSSAEELKEFLQEVIIMSLMPKVKIFATGFNS